LNDDRHASPAVNAPPHLSIRDVIAAAAARHPDVPAVLAPRRPPLTYAALDQHVRRTVADLDSLGLGPGDRVAVALPNGPETAVALLSIAATATCVPLNPAYSVEELARHLVGVGARAIVVEPAVESAARTAARESNIGILEARAEADVAAGVFTLRGAAVPRAPAAGFTSAEDVAFVLHTAGTTSRPKAVPLTHANVCTGAHNLCLAFRLSESDRCLSVLPLFHTHALLTALLPSLVAGGSIVCARGFDAREFFTALAELRPTWYTAVPAIHEAVIAAAPDHAELIARHGLRFVRSASASMSPALRTRLERTFGVPVVETYGMTEASGHITCNPPLSGEFRPGSVGAAVGPDLGIVDESGALLGSGESGEIVVSGPTVCRGYLDDPSGARTTSPREWLHTGDQGYLDADGYLFITGRLKEIVNRGGQKIAPREIEEVLLAHSAVGQAAVFAVPHPVLGEDVAAAVVCREPAPAEEELRAFAAGRLAAFKVPRRILFLTEIPKTVTGKVQRLALARRFELLLTADTPAEPKSRLTPRGLVMDEELSLLWARVLGLASVALDDDFFALGGTSLQAAALCDEIRHAFGVEISPSTLFEAPTVRRLSAIVQHAGSAAGSDLVALQSLGARPPFFCVHAGGGQALALAALARRLGSDRPFYALQANKVEPGEVRRIETIAARYVAAVRAQQSRGPYFIGGYCFGGSVAFEMAQQLRRQGEDIALLALVDAYAPGYPRPLPWRVRTRARVARHLSALRGRGTGERLSYLLEKLRANAMHVPRAGASTDLLPAEMVRTMREVYDAHHRAFTQYVPMTYPGKMILFRPGAQPPDCHPEPYMGWTGLAAGGLEIRDVPGEHQSLIVEPQVQRLAASLRECLDR
jgi:acyl-CoA synthetase (AMP-forming)/AMP-acid ligase II/thioesterase domain-containing protein/acyl carrier protein